MIPAFQFAFAGLIGESGGGGGGYENLLYIGNDAHPGNDQFETSNIDFTEGGASTNNKVIIGVFATLQNINDVSVQGNSATLIDSETTGTGDCALYIASFVPGGDHEIVVTMADSNEVHVCVWTVNMTSLEAHDTGTFDGTAGDPSVTIDIPSNGFCVGIAGTQASGQTHSVNASFTEDAEQEVGGSTIAANHREVTGAVSGVTVTDNFSAPSGNCKAVYASFAG